jgi:serine/threonine protein kinase
MIDQLRNEIGIMQIVEHKNIVRMSTYFEDESNIYLIMELGGVMSSILVLINLASPLLDAKKAGKIR